MKKRLKEMEDEAAALREMQAKVEKEMSSVQGLLSVDCFILVIAFCISDSRVMDALWVLT